MLRRLCALILLSPALSGAQPLDASVQRSLAQPFLRIPFRTLLLPSNKEQWAFSWRNANEFRSTSALVEDIETNQLEATYRRSLGPRWEIEARATLRNRGGGFMDPLIETWHRWIGFAQPLREVLPQGRAILREPGRFQYGSATGWGDLPVLVRHDLGDGWSAAAGLELPLGNSGQAMGNGRVDIGASLAKVQAITETLRFHAMLGWTWQAGLGGLPGSNRWIRQLAYGLEWRASQSLSILVQSQGETAPYRSLDANANREHRTLSIGARIALPRGESLTLWFDEDRDFISTPVVAGKGPDFGFGVLWTWRPR